MMAVYGKKNHNGKDILKLGNEFNLLLSLGVVDICRGKAHLKTDNRCAEFDSGKNQSGNKPQKKAKQNLGEEEQEEGEWGKIHLRERIGHYREEHQGTDKNQGGFHSHRGLGGEKYWNAGHESRNSGGNDKKGLELVYGEKGDFHWALEGDHGFEETDGENGEKLDEPGAEKQQGEKDGD